MYIVLSQKIDSESISEDELFKIYHFAGRYRNQLHEGDIFVYYQGNRFDRNQRYYFGYGTICEIVTADGENYYAKLTDCRVFSNKVPIYLPNGGYVEHFSYQTVRKRLNPPWQSSVRPLSNEAFDYILKAAGVMIVPNTKAEVTVDELKDKLKTAVREYFVEGDTYAIHRIESISAEIGRMTSCNRDQVDHMD